jgi:hypothetical protein
LAGTGRAALLLDRWLALEGAEHADVAVGGAPLAVAAGVVEEDEEAGARVRCTVFSRTHGCCAILSSGMRVCVRAVVEGWWRQG